MDSFFRGIFLAFVRIHLLHHAAEAPIYGLEMIEELARHGYRLSPGTLYPILHSMERSGHLVSTSRLVGGKVRKYYTATDEGRQALTKVIPQIRELVDEVVPNDQ